MRDIWSVWKAFFASLRLLLSELDTFSLKFALCLCGTEIVSLYLNIARHPSTELEIHHNSSSLTPPASVFLPHSFYLTNMKKSSHVLTKKLIPSVFHLFAEIEKVEDL